MELVITIDPPRPPATRCGMAALQACHIPVSWMSIMSCQVVSSSWAACPKEAIPALEQTMSSRPSWATPSSSALFSPA